MKRSVHARACFPARFRSHRRWSSGAVTLELILMLPIWIILMLAVIEFGLIGSNRQQVALASRVGAEEASRTPGLSTNNGDPVPGNVLNVIDQQLASSGLSRCEVVLQHNLGSVSPAYTTLASGNCDCPSPTGLLPTAGRAVRVTVFVPVTGLAPNLLRACGLDLSDRFIYHTTTFRHEL